MKHTCTKDCEASPLCAVCHKPKPPRGRSVAAEMAIGMCQRECPGRDAAPLAGHLFPGELETIEP